jgi:hypothetical protein
MTTLIIYAVKKPLKNPSGKFYDNYECLVTENADVFQIMEDGSKKILFKFRKNVISEELQKNARKIFEKHSKTINRQRGAASGGGKLINVNGITYSSKPCRSSISGSFDTVPMNLKKYFNTGTVCRLTAFTKNNIQAWKTSLPFFERIGYLYSKLSYDHYEKQMKAISKIKKMFRIGNTPFTTVTSNYNWRTACHIDKGDYSEGLGNLVVVGDNFKGCYLIFPEFRIAVDVRPGDFIIMDVHEYHCNTPLEADDNNVRISFVCYLREKMMHCNTKKIVDGQVYYHK